MPEPPLIQAAFCPKNSDDGQSERGGWFFDHEQGISLGCPLSPLMGAFFMHVLDQRMERTSLFYGERGLARRSERSANPSQFAEGRLISGCTELTPPGNCLAGLACLR